MLQVLAERNPLTMVRSLVKRRSGLKRELILCSFVTLAIHNLYYKVPFVCASCCIGLLRLFVCCASCIDDVVAIQSDCGELPSELKQLFLNSETSNHA